MSIPVLSVQERLKEIKSSSLKNKTCFDCDSENSNWASVNNSIYLCMKCALNHKAYLSKEESKIKSIEVYYWNEDEILLMKIGGNESFSLYIYQYRIELLTEDSEIRTIRKYSSKASEYYRNFLKSQIENMDFELKRPSVEEGREVIDKYKPIESYPHGENKSIIKSVEDYINNKTSQLITEEEKNKVKENLIKTKEFVSKTGNEFIGKAKGFLFGIKGKLTEKEKEKEKEKNEIDIKIEDKTEKETSFGLDPSFYKDEDDKNEGESKKYD